MPPATRETPRPLLRTVPTLVLTQLVALLALLLAAPGASAHHAGEAPGPVNAGNTFGWWHHDGVGWMEHWETGSLASYWDVEGRGVVQHQVGMMTLNTQGDGSVSATRDQAGSRYGRWEIRLRARRYETDGTDYRVLTELVPAARSAYRCGARNIALESLRPDARQARIYARGHRTAFRAQHAVDTRDEKWHTYAVEVRRGRIAWFIDSHVVRVEDRPAAVTGVPLTVRFTMKARKGATMNDSRMQMDWMRHFNLNAPNEKPTRAPRTTPRAYRAAC